MPQKKHMTTKQTPIGFAKTLQNIHRVSFKKWYLIAHNFAKC